VSGIALLIWLWKPGAIGFPSASVLPARLPPTMIRNQHLL